MDPSHREELHLAYLYGREIERLGWPWDVAGPDNLTVADGFAVTYGQPVDIVIRQYPTDFLHELPAMSALWRSTLAGQLLWLNDPRAVLAQAKTSLALLWECASQDRWLTRAERSLILRHLPPTGRASSRGWLERASARPEDWVLKPAFGRFSEGVAVGALSTPEAWQAGLSRAAERPEDWVIQAYVPPRRRWLPAMPSARGGYVNWGVYLAEGSPAGFLARLQPTPLTSEATAWWAPLRVRPERRGRPFVLEARAKRPARRRAARWLAAGHDWEVVADRAALAGYTNSWTDGLANFSLGAIGISASQWDVVSDAMRRLAAAVGRVLSHLAYRPDLASVLGVPGVIADLTASGVRPAPWSFLSRFDWALTGEGQWKLMEMNTDTPAGLWEAALVAEEIVRLHPGRVLAAPGAFWPALAGSWRQWTAELLGPSGLEQPVRVGLVGAIDVVEDLDQIRAHQRAARLALPRARLDIGSIRDPVARDGRGWMHGEPLDLLFRYHPLDWFDDPALGPLLDLTRSGALPMLPPAHCVLPQSKAFLALVWELLEQGFFPAAEAAAIRAHVPATFLDPARLRGRPYVVKPYLEREGKGVRFSSDLGRRARRRLGASEVIYQERVELTRVRLPVATARGWHREERTLVFGVFLAGDDVAGVYTRAGAPITGREAVFAPLVLTGG